MLDGPRGETFVDQLLVPRSDLRARQARELNATKVRDDLEPCEFIISFARLVGWWLANDGKRRVA